MKLLPILLCIFFCVPINCDNIVIYFGMHKEPLSKFIAITLNEISNNGIALNIPTIYIKQTIGGVILVYIGLKLYKHRKALLNLDTPASGCLCDGCLDRLSEQMDNES